jgi:hypothetical protein
VVLVIILCTNCLDYFRNIQTENYTPIISRYLPYEENQNDCPFPYTNNKLYKQKNENVYIYQYGNRKLLNPDQYLEMVRKLLNDLSTKNINIPEIPKQLLIEKPYEGDQSLIINFMNNNINNLVKTKDYLQHNGTWKYEYFVVSSPTIYYYEVDNKNKMLNNLPSTFNLFKIIYVLGNPLRSSYTSCLAFITSIDNKLELQYTTIVNDVEKQPKDNLKVLPQEALEFTFINTIANNEFDQFGNPDQYSGLNYIEEPRQGKKVNIKADIPNEFKENSFQPQYLPPQCGNGICKYPPYYKAPDGKDYYFNTPPKFPETVDKLFNK